MYFYMQVFCSICDVLCVFGCFLHSVLFGTKVNHFCQFFHRVMQTGARINFLCL